MGSSVHDHPPGTPDIGERPQFLIDGCARCEEYVENMGRSFDPERFRWFWDKMVDVEWDHTYAWGSKLDAALGHRLYLVSLQLQVAFGLHPRDLATLRTRLFAEDSQLGSRLLR